jgi:hypothetical protein
MKPIYLSPSAFDFALDIHDGRLSELAKMSGHRSHLRFELHSKGLFANFDLTMGHHYLTDDKRAVEITVS